MIKLKDKVIFYRSSGGEYRWKRVASNGRIVGASTEGYKKKSACTKNFYRSLEDAYTVEDITT